LVGKGNPSRKKKKRPSDLNKKRSPTIPAHGKKERVEGRRVHRGKEEDARRKKLGQGVRQVHVDLQGWKRKKR